jgi:hypothetical protein
MAGVNQYGQTTFNSDNHQGDTVQRGGALCSTSYVRCLLRSSAFSDPGERPLRDVAPVGLVGNASCVVPTGYALSAGQAAKHIIWWLAHRTQRPQEKINHGLALGR